MQPRRGPTQGMSSVRRKTKIFLQLVGSFFEAVAVPTRLAELIGGARQLPTSYPGEIVLLELLRGLFFELYRHDFRSGFLTRPKRSHTHA